MALTFGCGDVPPAHYPTTPPMEESHVAPLGVNDVIEVTIYNGSTSQKASFKIDSTGHIAVQYIGDVLVLEKTPDQVKDEIRTRLADGYLVDPIVSVIITEFNSLNLSVSGEVGKDGKIKYTPGMTIVDAIALCGGFTPMAKKNHVKVIRQLGEKEMTWKIPVAAIQDGNRPNFYVAAGDRIFVPERLW
ncbi:MAG: polysaccharide export protein [Deltaproteobacteria bacterium]|nr:polysaccharide export protein [Deltaproteobacteria bacterium]